MRIAAHEANALNELTLSCVNSITNMGYMLQHVQDPEFKSILQRHFPLHIRDYNMKVEFLNKREGATKELPLLKEEAKMNQFTEMIAPQAPPVQPRTLVENMNDREMATAYLLTLKRAGREYAWNAMEMANPEIRSFCQTAFMMSCSHAYDMWQYMVKKGYYVLEPADEMAVQKMGSMYLLVPETDQQMNGYMMNQNPTVGQSNQLYQ
ncbi:MULTISPECIES: spore coat protein [unclassified Niallia]|uniref:spore coat protein n=1 Tax=unclassified Niallia TaxID=2837522 RepID=UPI001EDC0F60|nr:MULTISPECIES: spore coat protein [unclassified Niallia]MDL0434669.1 spore coat protein [Niallia sp. SS-2023]UPO88370.1 spore coat protein [Niallia sp. Man26]